MHKIFVKFSVYAKFNIMLLLIIFLWLKCVLCNETSYTIRDDNAKDSDNNFGDKLNARSSSSSSPRHYSRWSDSAWQDYANFYRRVSQSVGAVYYDPVNSDDKFYSNRNTKFILHNLAVFAKTGLINKNRFTSVYGGTKYWHGFKFYSKTTLNMLTCKFEPRYTYSAFYEENNAQVKEIVFECENGFDYCCELECCSSATWWFKWAVGIPCISIISVLFCCCSCLVLCRKHEDSTL